MSTMESRVQTGIAWLDEVKPNWRDFIDWEALDMMSSRWCIAGQVFQDEAKKMDGADCMNGFEYVRQTLRVAYGNPVRDYVSDYVSDYGFDVVLGEYYEDLHEIWSDLA